MGAAQDKSVDCRPLGDDWLYYRNESDVSINNSYVDVSENISNEGSEVTPYSYGNIDDFLTTKVGSRVDCPPINVGLL